MFKVAVIFFFLGIIGLLFGVLGIGGMTLDVGEMIIALFFIFSLISFIGSGDSESENFTTI